MKNLPNHCFQGSAIQAWIFAPFSPVVRGEGLGMRGSECWERNYISSIGHDSPLTPPTPSARNGARGRQFSRIERLCWIILIFLATTCHTTAQQPSSKNKNTLSIELQLQTRSECPSNVLLLSDLVRIKGSDALVQQIIDVPLAPAPSFGNDQTWTRSDIEKSLALRGISGDVIRWQGALECNVRRIDGQRTEARIPKASDENDLTKLSLTIVPSSHQAMQGKQEMTNQLDARSNGPSIDKSQFTAPFTTSATITQAERIAAAAIDSYLQTKTASAGRWDIRVHMPTEHAKSITQRFKILGVAGGQPPWEGKQEFIFLINGPVGEQSITIPATVKLPDMVVAAKKALSKGYVLKEDDLVWIPMPRGLNYGPEECYSQTDLLVGQQLRRAMSTQQVIRLNEVGPAMIIHVGDLVGIAIVAGGVTVETNGRAMEAGAIDDLIQIEVQPHRKRVLARVTGDRTAEIISNGATNVDSAKRKAANPSSSTLKR